MGQDLRCFSIVLCLPWYWSIYFIFIHILNSKNKIPICVSAHISDSEAFSSCWFFCFYVTLLNVLWALCLKTQSLNCKGSFVVDWNLTMDQLLCYIFDTQLQGSKAWTTYTCISPNLQAKTSFKPSICSPSCTAGCQLACCRLAQLQSKAGPAELKHHGSEGQIGPAAEIPPDDPAILASLTLPFACTSLALGIFCVALWRAPPSSQGSADSQK